MRFVDGVRRRCVASWRVATAPMEVAVRGGVGWGLNVGDVVDEGEVVIEVPLVGG